MAAVCPLSVQDTDAGDGTRTQTDSVPSVELHAKRYLSSCANLMAVTTNTKTKTKTENIEQKVKQLFVPKS